MTVESPPESPPESPARASADPSVVFDGTLFPAGGAVFFLAVGFLTTRVLTGASAVRPWLASVGAFCAVTGAMLALVASLRLTFETTALRGRWGAFVGRAIALAPIAALGLLATFGTTLSQGLQLVALTGLTATLLVAGLRAAAIAAGRGSWLALATLGALILGEGTELFLPVVSFAWAPGASLPRLTASLGRLGELCAFVGIALALAWSTARTAALAGRQRALAFLGMPTVFTAVLMWLPARLPRTTELVARAAFAARFDLARVGGAGHPSRLGLAVYTLLFSGLVAAASVSLAALDGPRGAGARRSLAWTSLLLAGFGGLGMAGPVEPLRAVALTLGVLLLEQAVEHE